MEPITLIVAALAAGASSGFIDTLKDNSKDAAKAAYAKLRALARRRLVGRPDGERALEQHTIAPPKWEGLLTAELMEAGAADDTDLVAAAKAFMDLVDQASAKSGKYDVTIKASRNVVVGDSNIQIIGS